MLKSAESLFLVIPLLVLAWACGNPPAAGPAGEPSAATPASGPASGGPDPSSFSRPDEVTVTHLAWDATVDFKTETIAGRASLTLENETGADKLHLDTRDLTIEKVTLDDGSEAPFALGAAVEFFGQPLTIDIHPETKVVHIDYTTSPRAAAIQWLSPAQTTGGEHPFLFTQSQAILARTWIPLQDTPGVRFTYEATVRVPSELLALMSAENPTEKNPEGLYHFQMPQPIPSYLMALAVGDLAFRPLSERAGVYAEPAVVEGAAWEFAETEAMIEAAEKLYGPYRWGRYDLLVLPPSFPFGGMENPRLTFATPTILAGDRSLVALVAHELAHSWSGNLVTNADWNDFWLNEGFTTYFEKRIMEAVYGRDYSEMLASLSRQGLVDAIAEMGPDSPDTHLHLDLAGRDPDDGMTSIAYDKGYFFLRALEEAAGRERWDAFLRQYFDAFAFQPMTSERFVAHLREQLPEAAAAVNVEAWIYGPGLPEDALIPQSEAFSKVEAQLAAWQAGTPAGQLATDGWTTHEMLHFLLNLPASLSAEQLAELDSTFGLSKSGNAEIQAAWFEAAITRGYGEVRPALKDFLLRVGRRKFLRPLYAALAATPEGKEWAREVYAEARSGYHSVSTGTIDALLDWDGGGGSG